MKLLTGQSNSYLASQLSTELSIPLTYLSLKHCDNGEVLTAVDKSLHTKKVIVAHTLERAVNSSLMELLIIIDAVKSAGPAHLTLMLPYYAYGRQDRPTYDSTGSAAQLVMRLLAAVGIDQLVTVDSHNPNIFKNAVFKIHELTAIPLFAKLIQKQNLTPLIVAPDQGAAKRAEVLAEHLKTDWLILKKSRLADGNIVISSAGKVVENRNCIIVDDIIDSGKTLCLAADYLLKKGSKQIDAYVTHGVFGEGCLDRVEQSSLQSLIITNTIPLDPRALPTKVTCVDITPILINGLADG